MTRQSRPQRSAHAFVGPLLLAALFAIVQPAHAIHVYVMSSGNAALDANVQTLLATHGHTSTLGEQWFEFDGTASLAGVDAVYLQMNYNWDAAIVMPYSGQAALRDWVEAGGGLVTTAWAQYIAAEGALLTLGEIFPADPTFSSVGDTVGAYGQVIADPILNAGLPEEFTFLTDDIDGFASPLDSDPWTVFSDGPSSTVYFRSGTFQNGVMAGPAGAGWVINLSTTAGTNQIADANFSRLVVNTLVWVSSPHPPLPAAWCPCQVDPCTCQGPGSPMHVYIMASGEPMLDSAVQTLLTVYGHTSEIGSEWWQFNGTASLAGVDVVYMQMAYNQCGSGLCANADMPESGQAALRDWILAGGGLVTTEWTLRKATGDALDTLQTVFPAEPSTMRFGQRWLTFNESVADPILTDGLPATFTFPIDWIGGGSVTDCLPSLSRPDVVGVYDTDIGGGVLVAGIPTNGLVAGPAGAGAVINLGTLVGPSQLADANFSRLLVNSLAWASSGGSPTCLCEIDGDDAQVEVFDLLAYLDLWFAGSPDADIDDAAGVDVFDLLMFLDCWFTGC